MLFISNVNKITIHTTVIYRVLDPLTTAHEH